MFNLYVASVCSPPRSLPAHIPTNHIDIIFKIAPLGAKRVQIVLGPLTADFKAQQQQQQQQGSQGEGSEGSSWLESVQAAAITYEFDSCQLQVLVGKPKEVEEALREQNMEFKGGDDTTPAVAAAAALLEKAPGGAVGIDTTTSAAGGAGATPSGLFPAAGGGSGDGGTTATAGGGGVGGGFLCEGQNLVGWIDPMEVPGDLNATPKPEVRTLCCQLRGEPGDEVTLRLLLDYSILELFTGTGEVLTTRVYRWERKGFRRGVWGMRKG